MNSSSTAIAVEELKTTFGDQLSLSSAVRETHGRDESWHETETPDPVLFVKTVEHVSTCARICSSHT